MVEMLVITKGFALADFSNEIDYRISKDIVHKFIRSLEDDGNDNKSKMD